MDSGVTIIDPNRVDVRGTLSCGQNVTIDVNTVFIGDVTRWETMSQLHHSPSFPTASSVTKQAFIRIQT